MNKDNFMKALSMIDEDLIKEADTAYEPVAEHEKSCVSFSEEEHSSSVLGVDVYHMNIWKKFIGINTSTVRLLRDDMMRYVREAKHEPTFIDLPTE